MAITKSAKKAIRVSERKRIKNLLKMKKIKNLLKEVRNLVTQASAKGEEKASASSTSQKKVEEAKKLLPQVYKILDKAAKTGLMKRNTVARKKARITKLITRAAAKRGDERSSSTKKVQ